MSLQWRKSLFDMPTWELECELTALDGVIADLEDLRAETLRQLEMRKRRATLRLVVEDQAAGPG